MRLTRARLADFQTSPIRLSTSVRAGVPIAEGAAGVGVSGLDGPSMVGRVTDRR